MGDHEDLRGHGILNTILETGSKFVCDGAKPVLLHWATIPLAFGLIFIWHLEALNCLGRRQEGGKRRAHCGCRDLFLGDRSNRTMWEAWAVLHIYYSPHRPAWMLEYPFSISATFILVETFFFFLIRACVDNAEDESRRDSYIQQNAKVICNKYMDFSYRIRRVLLYFWVQGALMCYFVYWLNADVDTKSFKNISILKWIVAVQLTITAGEQDGVGQNFNVSYWKMLLRRDREKPVVEGWGWDRSLCIPWRAYLWIRAYMDCVVHGFTGTLLTALAPVALAVEKDTIDYIKDALALFFITKLDDLQQTKRLEECIKTIEEEEGEDRVAEWMNAWQDALEQERQESTGERGGGDRAVESDSGRVDNETTPLNWTPAPPTAAE